MDFGKDSMEVAPLHGKGQAHKPSRTQLKPSAQQNGTQKGSHHGSSTPKTKSFNNISMDEINKMIDERVKQVCFLA